MMAPTTETDTKLFLNKKKAQSLYLNYIILFSIRTKEMLNLKLGLSQ